MQATRLDRDPVRPAARAAVERVPWGLAARAVVLLPSWLHPTALRLYGGTTEIQGWGWRNVAPWMAALVLVALTAGLLTRPRVPLAVVCAFASAALFAVAAGEVARTRIDLTKEIANPAVYGIGTDYELVPATGMDRTFVVAVIGVASSLVLAKAWLRPGPDD